MFIELLDLHYPFAGSETQRFTSRKESRRELIAINIPPLCGSLSGYNRNETQSFNF